MGHSYGAALTVRAAAENPHLFRALVLLDPILLPTSLWLGTRLLARLGRNPMSRAARRRRDRWPSREEAWRSEEHTSELQSLMRISYAVFCLKKKTQKPHTNN